MRPRIQQHVAGAAIEAAGRLSRRQIGQVGDAADIEDDAMSRRVAEHCIVESRYQGRALAAGRDVAAAEVGHDRDAGQFGKQCRVVELQRVAMLGHMPDRLPMTADGMTA